MQKIVDAKASFTAASVLPVKLFKSRLLLESAKDGIIPPIHVQVNPTNKCNRKCQFCSCAKRDRGLELPISFFQKLIPHLASLGTKAVTITGGGEPLLYRDFDALIELCRIHGIQTGLVTNGDLLPLAKSDTLRKLTWCRISCSGAPPVEHVPWLLAPVIEGAPDVDWAFSYVVDRNHSDDTLWRYVAFASAKKFTHVRIVSDMLSETEVPDPMPALRETGINLDRVIYQPRKEWTKGTRRCLISLLKPNIGPDGLVYACCGVQYARSKASLDYDQSMSMGPAMSLDKMKAYDGSQCERCYYSQYNKALAGILRGDPAPDGIDDLALTHLNFV